MTAQIIHREEHNGIPVMWSDIRSTFSGVLTFGVGVQDETARRSGVTHLVEHLVMSQVGSVTISYNASTDASNLSFFAQGPAHLVADFLGRVAASIRAFDDLAPEVVAAEVAHISAELGEGNGRTGSGPLLDRYGATTFGLLDLGFPAHRSLTLEDAKAWARTWLHTGNAVLVFSGPVPEGLDVTLPQARPLPERAVPAALPYRVRGWIGGGLVPLALSFDLTSGTRGPKFVAGNVIDKVLHEELRTKRHLVYSVDGVAFHLTPTTDACTAVLDPQPANILATMEATLEVLRGLANEGPPQSVIAELTETWRNAQEDSDALYANLTGNAARWIRTGVEPAGIDHSPFVDADMDAVRAVIANALDTLLISFGEFETDMTPEQLTEKLQLPWAKPPAGYFESMTSGQLFKTFMRSDTATYDPKMFSGRRGQQMITDPERIAWVVPNLGIQESRWDHVILAGRCERCGLWDLTDRDGSGIYLQPAHWRGGHKLNAKVEQSLSAESRYPLEHAAWH